MRFDAPSLYARGIRCFVAADIITAWLQRGHLDSWWRWDIAEARRDYRPAAPPAFKDPHPIDVMIAERWANAIAPSPAENATAFDDEDWEIGR